MNNKNNYNLENNLVGDSKLSRQGAMNYGEYKKVYSSHFDNNGQYHEQPVSGQNIVAIQWDDQERRILAIKLEDGSVHDMDKAVRLAEEGKIKNVVIGHSAYGDPYLRGVGDGDKSNNLRNLPEF